MKVERILDLKGSHAATVTPDAKISAVLAALESEDVGALVVSTDGLHIDGIISERDVVRGLLSLGSKVLDHQVHELMSSDVVTCTADDHVAAVMALMDDRNIRHVPITNTGKLAGIVSIRDIVKLRLNEVQVEADAMRQYIGTA
ncbi:MAG: CBS domain-containing protein [Rhizobiales bacterium]|nr:CBS domain-containing protein [Hyphomicrobiales bacterium]